MKQKIQPTNAERVLREEDFIVSKTDLKGKITYANRIFCEYAGYSEKELVGKPHNIVRHPDMPRAVFRLLWDTIQQGKEIFAYVKNLAKDGAFYWVYANVTPVKDRSGTIVGYHSVRRKPNERALEIIERLYFEMRRAESWGSSRSSIDVSTRLLSTYLQERNLSYEQFIIEVQRNSNSL